MESYKNPTWDSTESISVFINNVNEQVRNQISNFEARKKFISALYDNLGPSLEYDGSFYTKITFMFDFHTKNIQVVDSGSHLIWEIIPKNNLQLL